MKHDISEKEREYAQLIYGYRKERNYSDAITMCDNAILEFPQSNFFYKIKGDILFETEKYTEALNIYLLFLNKIKDEPEYFTNFTRFFNRVSQEISIEEQIYNRLACMVCNKEYPYGLTKNIMNLLLDTYSVPFDLNGLIDETLDTKSINTVKTNYEKVKKQGKCRELIYLCKVTEGECYRKNIGINRYILKRVESNRLYDQAISWTKRNLSYTNDPAMIRTLFRLCREVSDYSDAEEYLGKNNIIEIQEFNIQYELVLYFDYIGDEKKRNDALQCIEKLAANSLPIYRTLFNFYVRFNMLDEAQKVQKSIMNLDKSKQAEKVQQETEDIVWERLRSLISEQEHSRQLMAVSELIKGFSHELGQPITNIRYAIQLFYMKSRKSGDIIKPEEKELLDGVLKQTERVGKLLNRFSPIISSKSEKKFFNVFTAISNIFDELSSRLNNEGIEVTIQGDNQLEVYGEELQFGQVFYNLIINSIYAIRKKDQPGQIMVDIKRNDDFLKINFFDNGIGIPFELRRKIFNAFFSTKNKEVEEGGEGLGLFIVWNILKIFSGRIYVDEFYDKGAKFVIEINLKENLNV